MTSPGSLSSVALPALSVCGSIAIQVANWSCCGASAASHRAIRPGSSSLRYRSSAAASGARSASQASYFRLVFAGSRSMSVSRCTAFPRHAIIA